MWLIDGDERRLTYITQTGQTNFLFHYLFQQPHPRLDDFVCLHNTNKAPCSITANTVLLLVQLFHLQQQTKPVTESKFPPKKVTNKVETQVVFVQIWLKGSDQFCLLLNLARLLFHFCLNFHFIYCLASLRAKLIYKLGRRIIKVGYGLHRPPDKHRLS